MRLLRRNALGVYAVYGAAVFSGLVVTPIVIRSLGKSGYGVWSFIGAVTIYLSLLDFGVGPAIVRFGAEARGRRAPHELNEIASTGLVLYAVIGAVTLPVGAALSWLVPWFAHVHGGHLVWESRIATFLVVLSLALRFPLGLFNNLLIAQQRWDVQNVGNFLSTALYAGLVAVLMPRYGSLILVGALTLGATLLRLMFPLAWLRRELPHLRLRRRFVTRSGLRELTLFSSSNFLVQVAQKIVFSTDVIVVTLVLGSSRAGVYSVAAKLFALAFGIGTAATSLMFPAFAELEGSAAVERQRRLLLSGLRAGTGLMLLLALPMLLIPDLLIDAWIRRPGFDGSHSVMAILAVVLLIHQPIFVLTQFLIARARQREVAIASICATLANLVLSFVLAWVWGIDGVAVSTLATDAVLLVWIVPRLCAPAAGVSSRAIYGAIARPIAPALVAGAIVFVGVARVLDPSSLVTLAPLGALWALVAAAMLWRFGLAPDERARFRGQFFRRASATPA